MLVARLGLIMCCPYTMGARSSTRFGAVGHIKKRPRRLIERFLGLIRGARRRNWVAFACSPGPRCVPVDPSASLRVRPPSSASPTPSTEASEPATEPTPMQRRPRPSGRGQTDRMGPDLGLS